MRPIKFKGKAVMTIEELERYDIPHENGWVTGNLIQNGDRPVISSDIYELIEESIYPKWWVVVEVDSVGQYTGLKDKNGTEIYEGDIVSITNLLVENIEPYAAIVEWDNARFTTNVIGSTSTLKFPHVTPHGVIGPANGLDSFGKNIEVIGNIYEDKHLLEVQT